MRIGTHHTEETKAKMRQYPIWCEGEHLTEEHRAKIGGTLKGNTNGKGWIPTLEQRENMRRGALGREPISEETRKKLSIAHHGHRRHSDYQRKILRQRMLGNNFGSHACSDEQRQNLSLGVKRAYSNDPQLRVKISQAKMGEQNPQWRGGMSNEPYPLRFDKTLKARIRARDDHRCKVCGILENGRHHDVHHIDYDKHNIDEMNLITLCHRCNTKANVARDYWTLYLRELITIKELESLRAS